MKHCRPLLVGLATTLMLVSQGLAYEFTSLGNDGGWKDQPVQIVLDGNEFTSDGGLATNAVEEAVMSAFDSWARADENDKLNFSQLSDLGGNYDVFDGFGGSLDQSADWTTPVKVSVMFFLRGVWRSRRVCFSFR